MSTAPAPDAGMSPDERALAVRLLDGGTLVRIQIDPGPTPPVEHYYSLEAGTSIAQPAGARLVTAGWVETIDCLIRPRRRYDLYRLSDAGRQALHDALVQSVLQTILAAPQEVAS